MPPDDSTIAAISTPAGTGGIGIVRLSGPSAVKITSRVFRPGSPSNRIKKARSHTLHYGHIICKGRIVDEVLVSIMRAPKTYTREDIAEINCHGGIIPLKKTLSLVLSEGARMANPGEFTERAFMNGRIDLSQAEAAADIINAATDAAGEIAISHLKGDLKKKVDGLSSNIAALLAEVEASIEFPDECEVQPRQGSLSRALGALLEKLRKMLASSEYGRIVREGLNVAIAGLPNAGKSSIFNALLGEDRVIVTPAPGTTRDIVEGVVSIEGIAVTLADTAGINEKSEDPIEREAVGRSSERAKNADIILFVLDGSRKAGPDDFQFMRKLNHKTMLIAVNKSDLPRSICMADVRNSAGGEKPAMRTSASSGEGIEELKSKIAELALDGSVGQKENGIVSNRRHIEALKKTESSLAEALESLKGFGMEVTALNLRSGLDALGEITGASASEELLSAIFSRFCIGK
jgi:tRNA modification GTPase